MMRKLVASPAKPLHVTAVAAIAFGAAAALPANSALAYEGSSPAASVINDTLVISGTSGRDSVTLGVGADPTTMVVAFPFAQRSQTFARASFHGISVTLGNGDDIFSVNPQAQFADAALTVVGGRGND